MSLAGFAVAVTGAFLAFLPLMQILLPLKAQDIAPGAHGQATALLGTIAATGAVIAGFANVAVGWLSDRTRSRLGRRRPWIVAGLIGVVASDAAIWRAQSPATLIAAFVAFQLAFNMVFAPLLALLADRIEEARRGWAAALIGLGKPCATIVGMTVVGSLFTSESSRFAVLAALTLATILPFTLHLREDPIGSDGGGPNRDGGPDEDCGSGPNSPARWLSGNLVLAWSSRVCIVMAFTVAQLYLLFYLAALLPAASSRAVADAVTVFSVVCGIVSAAAGIVAGRYGDRVHRRRPLVLAGALAIAAGMAAMALAPSWWSALLAYTLFAAGAGVHTACEFALVVDILPARDRAGQSLGILNLSNIVPQVVAPLAVTWLVALPGATIRTAFLAAAVVSALGALLLAFMRGVR